MFNRVHHVSYVVPSIDEIAAYLDKYFGLKPSGISEPPGWGFKSLVYQIGVTQMDFAEPYLDENGEAVVRREPAMMFAKQLKERGPGLAHVAWGVDIIEQIFHNLKDRGLQFDTTGGHATPVHVSVNGGYKVLNIEPKHVGTRYANAEHGVFFQLAEGDIVPMPGWQPYPFKK